MNMKELFDDFKKHVNSMDDNDIVESIRDATNHSSNSAFLDGETETMNDIKKNVDNS